MVQESSSHLEVLVWITDALCEVLPSVQAVVQGIALSSSPGHLQAGEASGPVPPGVHRHHPAQPIHPGPHEGQAQIAGLLH